MNEALHDARREPTFHYISRELAVNEIRDTALVRQGVVSFDWDEELKLKSTALRSCDEQWDGTSYDVTRSHEFL